jgi:alcohol dehydrogenase
MRAVYYKQFQGPVEVRDVVNPLAKEGSVVVKVEATGLCRSDWHGWMGHDSDILLPHVPGHEVAGIVIETGEGVKNWKTGDRVTVPFVGGCGHCPECNTGNHQVCDYQFQPGFTAWGSFAEYVEICYADINLVRLPDDMSFVTAAGLGCRFVTSFRAVVDQGKTKAGEWLAVHGCGGAGLSAVMIAAAMGAGIVAIDIDDAKLELAQKVGAHVLINAKRVKDIPLKVKEATGGGAHVSIDALGSQETCFNSVACLRKRGKHIQVGLMTGQHRNPLLPMDKVVANELEIIGSHGMQAYRYTELFELIRNKKLNPGLLIGKTISLNEVPFALMKMDTFEHTGITVINEF